MARLEHINITVSDPAATAARLKSLFGWRIRWEGDAIHGGKTIHVGDDRDYLAIYAKPGEQAQVDSSYGTVGGLNHIGLVVEDLDEMEKRVLAIGLKPEKHADYEPGRRFYFYDPDGIEFEIVSYS